MDFPQFLAGFYDMRPIFVNQGIDVDSVCSGDVCGLFNQSVPGHLHDVHSILIRFQVLFGRGTLADVLALISTFRDNGWKG